MGAFGGALDIEAVNAFVHKKSAGSRQSVEAVRIAQRDCARKKEEHASRVGDRACSGHKVL